MRVRALLLQTADPCNQKKRPLAVVFRRGRRGAELGSHTIDVRTAAGEKLIRQNDGRKEESKNANLRNTNSKVCHNGYHEKFFDVIQLSVAAGCESDGRLGVESFFGRLNQRLNHPRFLMVSATTAARMTNPNTTFCVYDSTSSRFMPF